MKIANRTGEVFNHQSEENWKGLCCCNNIISKFIRGNEYTPVMDVNKEIFMNIFVLKISQAVSGEKAHLDPLTTLYVVPYISQNSPLLSLFPPLFLCSLEIQNLLSLMLK